MREYRPLLLHIVLQLYIRKHAKDNLDNLCVVITVYIQPVTGITRPGSRLCLPYFLCSGWVLGVY